MNTISDDIDSERTVPPIRTLRYETPAELYAGIPQLAGFTQNRPQPEEDALGYLGRLRFSTTPEDAVTYTAFAVEPRVAIQWGMDAIRHTTPDLMPEDAQLLNWVAHWLEHPNNETRWRTLQVALFAPRRSPIVYLGLAAGWSGGELAPNDPSHMPPWRAPQAVNTAVLNAVAATGAANRSVSLARVLDLAAGLFRVYES